MLFDKRKMILSHKEYFLFLFVIFFYLGSHVIRRSTEGVGGSVEKNLQLAHAKISYPNMPVEIKQHIV